MVIGICDDQEYTLDYLKRLVKSDSNEHKILCFDSGRKLLEYIKNASMQNSV